MASIPLSRIGRLFLIVLAVVLCGSLYAFYPSSAQPPSPADRATRYEAGGIDSEHWRDRVVPSFEDEEGRSWDHEVVVGGPGGEAYSDSATRPGSSGLSADLLNGEVIMPKLENATAKSVSYL